MTATLLRRCDCGATYELLTMGTPCPTCGDHLAGRLTASGKHVPRSWSTDWLQATWKVYQEGWAVSDVAHAVGVHPEPLSVAWRRLGFTLRSQPETYAAKRALLQDLFEASLARHGLDQVRIA